MYNTSKAALLGVKCLDNMVCISTNIHCYADDTQMYLSMKPDETNQLVRLQACLKDLKT